MKMVAITVLAAIGSTIIIGLMLRSGAVGPLDQPNRRSLHDTPVPRSGGLGILFVIFPVAVWTSPSTVVVVCTAILGLLSWLDDRHSLPVIARFVGHLTAAVVSVYFIAPPSWPFFMSLIVILGVVWMTNLYNFMDGANGLAGGMTVVGFASYAIAALLAGCSALSVFCAAIAGGAAGFLVFNFDPARIFMGDVGSIPLGFLASALGIIGYVNGAWPLWFPLLVFAPFVIDATVTLLRRMARREKFWAAHRQHYYQRLVRLGWSHRRLALAEYALMASCGGLALALLVAPPWLQAAGVAACLAIHAVLMWWIDRRWAVGGEPA